MDTQEQLHRTVDEALKILKNGQAAVALSMLSEAKGSRVAARDLDLVRAMCFIQLNRPYDARLAIQEELRYFPDNRVAADLLKELEHQIGSNVNPPPSAPDEFKQIAELIRPYTMLGTERLLNLYTLAKTVCQNDIPGNFVECGVAAGGSSALLARTIKLYTKRPRLLFSVDSFSGMPDPTQADVHEGIPANELGWGIGTCSAPEASLLQVSNLLGVTDIVRPIKGYFENVLPTLKSEIGAIALLHLDGDWYESTIAIFSNLYDQIAPGGFFQIDDYGYWEGCRKATHEFENSRNLSFQINKIDDTGVWIQKQS